MPQMCHLCTRAVLSPIYPFRTVPAPKRGGGGVSVDVNVDVDVDVNVNVNVGVDVSVVGSVVAVTKRSARARPRLAPG